MEPTATHTYEIFLLILIAAFIGVFVYTVHTVLSPILIIIAVLILAFPLRRHTAVKYATAVITLLFVIWFFHEVSSVLAPVCIAFLIAYILDPLVDLLTKKKLPRVAAVICVMLSFIVFVVAAIILAVPVIIQSFEGFNPQQIGHDINTWINTVVIPKLVSFGIQESDIQNFFRTKVLPHIESILSSVISGIANVALGLTTILGQVANAVIIPILMFYILLDWDRIKQWIKNLFPEKKRETARRYYKKIDSILSAYLRGAITITLINMMVVTTLFSIVGIPFGVVLGILSGLFTLIPQFGVLITVAISLLVSLFGPSPGIHALFVMIILIGENLLESSVLYPKIVGDALGLHPAALIISLLVFAYFFGFIGMLVAVPMTSLLARLLEEWLERRDEPVN